MFSEIIGHNTLRGIFSSLVDKPGTFLFYGPPSVGKRTIACEISKYDLCIGKKEENCLCGSCQVFKSGHPDFLFVGERGKILVEDLENILKFSSRASLISKTKVVVIDCVESTSVEAANRLLKILEESPFSFFLISSDYNRVLPTICSRCFKVKFDLLSSEDISNILFKKMGFDILSSRVLGWIGTSSSVDIFANAGSYLKHRELVCDFVMNIRNLLSSLDFIDKIDPSCLGIFSDMLVLLLTDVLLLKNGIEDIINADKRDILQKLSKALNDKALVFFLGLLSQVKKNSYLNVNQNFMLKRMLIKAHPMLSVI